MQILTVHGVVTDNGTVRIENIETPVGPAAWAGGG